MNVNAATPVARTFSIGKADQQITFDALANKTSVMLTLVSTRLLHPTWLSFLPRLVTARAGNQVHLTGAGQCTITASQDGDANVNAAAPVARTFTISKADQQITFDALTDKKFGDADFPVNATASSNLA